MPWRRKEISPAGITLALLVWAYASAMWGGDWKFYDAYEPSLMIAFVCAGAASIGTMVRARWSTMASAISAVALFGIMFSELGELFMSRSEFNVWWIYTFGTLCSGAIAATVATFVSWRTARPATSGLAG
jgi:ABC-type Mn2+/Zn2+ transport system permease subunit